MMTWNQSFIYACPVCGSQREEKVVRWIETPAYLKRYIYISFECWKCELASINAPKRRELDEVTQLNNLEDNLRLLE